MFPDNNIGSCDSLGGKRHFQCPGDKAVCIPADITLAPDFNSSSGESCRLCQDRTEWRCNDGRCINATLYRDGRPNCRDASDEVPFKIYWYYILSATFAVVITGICVSLICRHLSGSLYSSATTALADIGDTVDGPVGFEEEFPDIPCELIELFEDDQNWMEEEDGKTLKRLKPEKLKEAVKKYIYLYTDPIQYHNLYMYLAHRSATLKDLNRFVKYLWDWEGDIHGENRLEILKAWRLHLGVSAMTQRIMDSVADSKSLDDQVDEAVDPARRMLRKWRRQMLKLKPLEDHWIYKSCSISYFSLIPVIEGSFFYFERFKNLIYIHIFYTALQDLSKDDPLRHTFEFSLVLFMSLAVGVVQLLNVSLSVYYAEEILEVGHERSCRGFTLKKVCFKLLAGVLSPFFPIIVLANHVFYESKTSMLRRHLQVEDIDEEISSTKQSIVRKKIELYQKIRETEGLSLFYRKLYSYYRVVSAVVESCTVLVCLLLLLFVTGRPGREINLIKGVENKLYSFFEVDVSDTSGLLSQLNIKRDIVIFSSIGFSLLVILTALRHYWYESKNRGISVRGQVCLGHYLLFLTINKVTTATSLLATTEPTNDKGATDPNLSLPGAVVILGLLSLLRLGLVYVYKRWFSVGRNGPQDEKRKLGWDYGEAPDKMINIIVNCLVVTPFMAQTDPMLVLKRLQKGFISERRGERLRHISEDGERGNELGVGDLRSQIRKMWWKDPSEKLSIQTVKRNLIKNNKLPLEEEDTGLDKNVR